MTVLLHSKENDSTLQVKGPVCCIGDLHGNITEALEMWERVRNYFKDELNRVTFVFLGDYCDRGPNTKEVINWLLELQKTNLQIYFLAGNHDFSFLAFLGILELPIEYKNKSTSKPFLEQTNPGTTKSYWHFNVDDTHGIHFYGRKWPTYPKGYGAIETIKSYGVDVPLTKKFINQDEESKKCYEKQLEEVRQKLIKAVPQSHKEFLKNLNWVVEIDQNLEDNEPLHNKTLHNETLHKETLHKETLHKETIHKESLHNETLHKEILRESSRKIICVHSGLHPEREIKKQVQALRKKLFLDPELVQDSKDISNIVPFNARALVHGVHPEFDNSNNVIVSGHHSFVNVGKNRIIMDSGGGWPGKTIQAIVLHNKVDTNKTTTTTSRFNNGDENSDNIYTII